jgi:hypothetical protein
MKSDAIGLYGALFMFCAIAFFLVWARCTHHIVLGVGVTLVLYATSGGDLVGSLLAGGLLALVMYFMGRRRSAEGFEDGAEDDEEEVVVAEEVVEEAPKKKKVAGAKKAPAPDHADRPAEMLELGKKYKMPASEKEDQDFHLDAGTTFMTAYKSLKPEQIAAMTKDTQELMETQKQLMGTLQTLKPLISDGKQMMEMFQSYFGSSKASLN